MALKLKTRGNELKKVLIYGLDGTGKSTFAEQYCNENNLKPIVIDIDDTNYTNLDIVDIDLENDIKAYQNIKNIIKEIKTSEYDTIILDGVSALLELLTSKANGMRAYKDRADRWSSILQAMINSNKNLIFIGQADMEVIFNEEFQSPKPIIKVNSIVNEKYLTLKEGKNFTSRLEKYRGKNDERKAPKKKARPAKNEGSKPKPVKTEEVIEDVTPTPELNEDEIQKYSQESGIIKALTNKLNKDKKKVTVENIIQEAIDDERLHPDDVAKIRTILEG